MLRAMNRGIRKYSSSKGGGKRTAARVAERPGPVPVQGQRWPRDGAEMTKVVVQFDGGARGNPGCAGAGFVIKNASGQVVGEGSSYVGPRSTNNEAEYHGAISGLQAALEHVAAPEKTHVVLQGDSQLVVKQLSGAYRVKAQNLAPLRESVKEKAGQFGYVAVEHIRREHNSHADSLANDAMDRGH